MDLRQQLQETLGDAYSVERELGGGGMSRVFVATDTALGRKVVVKVLPPDMAVGVSVDRFRREIALAARLQHPHIVPLLGASATAMPLWFTTPYVEGHSLRERLARGGELPIAEAVRVLREIADALAYAHRHGVVHRDIKPENVLLGEGHALVTDFGVAKALSESSGEERVTQTGVALGTPSYMSPEQASADPNVDHRADIYAFGVLAYELLAGRPPFTGASMAQVISAHIRDAAAPISTLRPQTPPELASLVMRCLEKRPADRPQSADELLAALATLTTPTGTIPQGATPSPSRLSARGWAVAATALIIAGSAIVWGVRQGDARGRPRIVVAPFANETGDRSFDEFGKVVAGWVQDGLVQSGVVDVIDFRGLTGAGTGAAAGNPRVSELADAAGASIVLHGSVSRFGDSVEMRASIVNAGDNSVIATIPAVRAPAVAPMPAVDQLSQRATGAFATLLDAEVRPALSGATRLPTFNAYREFSAGMDDYRLSDPMSGVKHFEEAIRLDPDFLPAQLWLAGLYWNNLARAIPGWTRDSVERMLARLHARRTELSELDRSVLDYRIAALELNQDKMIDAIRRAAELWPDRYAYNLAQVLNYDFRVREALGIMKKLDPAKGFMRGWTAYWQVYANSLMMLRDYEGALAAMRRARQQYPNATIPMCYEFVALIALQRAREADSLANAQLPGSTPATQADEGWCRGVMANAAMNYLSAEAMRPILESSRRFFSESARDPAAARANLTRFAFYDLAMGDTAGFVRTIEAIPAPAPVTRAYHLQRAFARAVLRDRAGAERVQAAALALPRPRLDFGATERQMAAIAVALGDKDLAVRLIKEAQAKGQLGTNLMQSWQFRSLIGYPPFERLVQ